MLIGILLALVIQTLPDEQVGPDRRHQLGATSARSPTFVLGTPSDVPEFISNNVNPVMVAAKGDASVRAHIKTWAHRAHSNTHQAILGANYATAPTTDHD